MNFRKNDLRDLRNVRILSGKAMLLNVDRKVSRFPFLSGFLFIS